MGAVLLHLSDLELITVMEAFKGKYERTSAENYEELLKLFEVNFLLRKAATASNPVVEITEEGGEWTIKQSTTLKTVILKFKLGEEFDETTPDGREVKTVLTFEEGKLVTVQTANKEAVGHQGCQEVSSFHRRSQEAPQIQARNRRSPRDQKIPEVYRAPHQEVALPASCERNCSGFQD